jgi:hypothetical protein
MAAIVATPTIIITLHAIPGSGEAIVRAKIVLPVY